MPTLADTSVWIDHFRDYLTPQVLLLRERAASDLIQADLVLMEVLQGIPAGQRVFERTRAELLRYDIVRLAGEDLASQSAINYRALRARGRTIRSGIDCLIATFCIVNSVELLHNDRDFEPFEQHLGLRVAR
ncbi:MAG: PIN domain-containing protein [Chloroflexi bacterium]|nr:PIN domain-containing protein [Chloroflexota bacterium]